MVSSYVIAALLASTCPTVPHELVHAIVAVESSGDPYVLNVGVGSTWKAYRFDDIDDAKVFLQAALQVTQNVDIGLMQVNWKWWGKHIGVTASELLDVPTNLRVGCDILSRELAGKGPLWQRIGRYHSRTPWRNEQYALKVIHETIR